MTNTVEKISILPSNPEGLTNPDEIDWNTIDPMVDINWREIDFLVAVERDGKWFLRRHESVPHFTGFAPVLAYQLNFVRFMLENCENGEAIVEEGSRQGVLTMTGHFLANGGELPLE